MVATIVKYSWQDESSPKSKQYREVPQDSPVLTTGFPRGWSHGVNRLVKGRNPGVTGYDAKYVR